MFVYLRLAEVLTSLVHLYAFSFVFARLAENDPLGAILLTAVAIFCVVVFAVVVIGVEFGTYEVRRRLRKLEESEQRKRASGDKAA